MNLFELTKDGKCVGYLRFTKYSDKDLHIQLSVDGDIWDDDTELVDYNSIHPFVCTDKNGEKVFAGDKAIGVNFMEDCSPYQVKGEVKYHEASFCIVSNYAYYQINDLLEIELIKDNDS